MLSFRFGCVSCTGRAVKHSKIIWRMLLINKFRFELSCDNFVRKYVMIINIQWREVEIIREISERIIICDVQTKILQTFLLFFNYFNKS